MDKEPTEAQVKEFWEWCGFKFHNNYRGASVSVWEAPDGLFYSEGSPPIDLNNLFKYAVPKLTKAQRARLPGIFSDNGRLFVFHWFWDNPALTLFWALGKVRDK